MTTLRSLLVETQTNLDRLRVRERYVKSLIDPTAYDTHRQYGAYAEFWDEWYEQVIEIRDDLQTDVVATAVFVSELREFITYSEATDTDVSLSVLTRRTKEMTALAKEAVACQKDMLHITDTRLSEHKEFTHKLLLVEALDSLNEE
jgi:hypothetical protein